MNKIYDVAKELMGSESIWYDGEMPTSEDEDGDMLYPVVVKETAMGNNMIELLQGLPLIAHHQQELFSTVGSLLELIARQQKEILELNTRVDDLMRANVSVKIQENMNDIIFKLVEMGSDVNKPEVTLKLSATLKRSKSRSSKSSKADDQSNINDTNVKALLKATAIGLGNMDVSTDVNKKIHESAKIVESLDVKSDSSEETSFSGDLVYKFDSITGNPAKRLK